MNYTENYNLKKPEGTDFYDIADQNDNMDAIDQLINALTSRIPTGDREFVRYHALTGYVYLTGVKIVDFQESGTTIYYPAIKTVLIYVYTDGTSGIKKWVPAKYKCYVEISEDSKGTYRKTVLDIRIPDEYLEFNPIDEDTGFRWATYRIVYEPDPSFM